MTRGADCDPRALRGSYPVDYAGNGAYGVTVTNFDAQDFTCATPLSTEKFCFGIVAGTTVQQPTAPFLLRQRGSFDINVLGLNPGADPHEVRFAPDATVGPDGAIVGNSAKTTADKMTAWRSCGSPARRLHRRGSSDALRRQRSDRCAVERAGEGPRPGAV